MIKLPPYDPKLQTLFDLDIPNSPALWAVLKGVYAGAALVDDERDPSQCVLRTDTALTYFSQKTYQAFLDEAIAKFRGAGPVWLVWPHGTTLSPPYLDDAVVVPRVEFCDCDPVSETLIDLRQQLPEGCRIRNLDTALFHRCEWRDEMAFYGGGFEHFLIHGLGVCMLQGDEIIVEAYASALGKTRAEIGAITRENHRGRGYAPIACAATISSSGPETMLSFLPRISRSMICRISKKL